MSSASGIASSTSMVSSNNANTQASSSTSITASLPSLTKSMVSSASIAQPPTQPLPGSNSLDRLPLEVLDNIAGFLDNDQDLWSYVSSCRGTFFLIRTAHATFWKKMFARAYDLPPSMLQSGAKREYQNRAIQTRTVWFHGMSRPATERTERICLKVLKRLIVEAYVDAPIGQELETYSKNMVFIRNSVRKSNILDTNARFSNVGFTELRKLLQVVLTHLQLDSELRFRSSRNTSDQQCLPMLKRVIYGHPSLFPMFNAQMTLIQSDFLLYLVKFWRYHFRNEESEKHPEFQWMLEDGLDVGYGKPGPWTHHLKQDPAIKIGPYWCGMFVKPPDSDEIEELREDAARHIVGIDDLSTALSDVEFNFDPAVNTSDWPPPIESHVNALPSTTLCQALNGTTPVHPRRAIDYIQFIGDGKDETAFYLRGILHNLPPQAGIPGWKRISFLTWLMHRDPTNLVRNWGHASYSDPSPTFNEECFKFEGVVLPGDKIILGRWESVEGFGDGARDVLGPFIYWAKPERE